MSQHSRISSRFLANKLNFVSNYINLGDDILIEPKFKDSKEVIVLFLVIVA
jgi:hypothetical protein